MKKQLQILTAALMLAVSGTASSTVVPYFDRGLFNAAHPGLGVETFEAANVAPNAFVLLVSPLSSATNNTVFAGGSILAGLSVTDNPGPSVGGLVVFGKDTATGGTKSVGATLSAVALSLIFDPSHIGSAVGFDLFLGAGLTAPISDSVSIKAYDSGKNLIYDESVSLSGIDFFGIASTSNIMEIDLQNPSYSEFVDNVAFGPAPTVPEPATLLLTGAGLAGLAWSRRSA